MAPPSRRSGRRLFLVTGGLFLVTGARALVPQPSSSRQFSTALSFELGTITSEGIASALVGGAIGTIGSVVAIEAKKVKVKKSKQCPYCMGTGGITCASCLGTGFVTTSAGERVACGMCDGQKVHTCENCKGRGRFIPTMLDSRISRDPESELEEVGLQ